MLWHGCQPDDVCYETAIGTGRPAWNIQDAAIVTKQFGFTIDVSCGGVDNLVRHHDYTLAIAEAVSGQQFSWFWLHGAHLLVGGKKMSKSLGNVYYVNDVLSRGFSGEQLRFFLSYRHYRKKLNFTFDKFAQTCRKLDEIKSMVADLQNMEAPDKSQNHRALTRKITADFERYMDDDLDLKNAFDSVQKTIINLHEMRRTLGAEDVKNLLSGLRQIDSVLQFIF
ncbi:MAG: class I tRNA ligase family protein [Candidatus Bathyarchaeota archaeon]|nr:class I tRNA ligase family protein [Candidatus Bathyarchaeota archaeon]